MRAIEPVEAGQVHLEGFQVGYEVFGPADAPAVLLLPTWQIVHSRVWKMQVPFLARSFRIVTFDSAGNGMGERTTDPRAYEYDRIGAQAIGLLDHLGIETASVIAFSRGCDYAIAMAAHSPERIERLMLIACGVTSTEWQPQPDPTFWEQRASYDGWQMRNVHFWREHYRDWLEFFFAQLAPEPHSTKGIEDCIGWGLETTPEMLTQTLPNPDLFPRISVAEALQRITCPTMLMHGDNDYCNPIDASLEILAMRPDWSFVCLEGCGHLPIMRHPVRVNLLIREFLMGSPDVRREVMASASV